MWQRSPSVKNESQLPLQAAICCRILPALEPLAPAHLLVHLSQVGHPVPPPAQSQQPMQAASWHRLQTYRPPMAQHDIFRLLLSASWLISLLCIPQSCANIGRRAGRHLLADRDSDGNNGRRLLADRDNEGDNGRDKDGENGRRLLADRANEGDNGRRLLADRDNEGDNGRDKDGDNGRRLLADRDSDGNNGRHLLADRDSDGPGEHPLTDTYPLLSLPSSINDACSIANNCLSMPSSATWNGIVRTCQGGGSLPACV